MDTEYNNLVVSNEGGLVTISVNRPKAYNAMNTETLLELERVLKGIEEDPSARVVIVTGNPKVFVAGADVTELMNADSKGAYENCGNAHRVFLRLENLPLPTIAAVNGPALGGGMELALSCDFRIAGENALLGLPEITLGIIPGAGGTQRLTKLVGAARAKELILLGKPVKGQRAYEMGIVNQMVPDELVMNAARELAATLMERPATALRLAKECVNYSHNEGLDKGIEFERTHFSRAFESPDQKEGMGAFVEKRKPNFTNK